MATWYHDVSEKEYFNSANVRPNQEVSRPYSFH